MSRGGRMRIAAWDPRALGGVPRDPGGRGGPHKAAAHRCGVAVRPERIFNPCRTAPELVWRVRIDRHDGSDARLAFETLDGARATHSATHELPVWRLPWVSRRGGSS
jgi:hypothetical protein